MCVCVCVYVYTYTYISIYQSIYPSIYILTWAVTLSSSNAFSQFENSSLVEERSLSSCSGSNAHERPEAFSGKRNGCSSVAFRSRCTSTEPRLSETL